MNPTSHYFGLLNSEEYGDMMRELAQNTPSGVTRANIDRDYDGVPDGNYSPMSEAWGDKG